MTKAIHFDRDTEKFKNLTEQVLSKLEAEHPDVDVVDELRAMKLWLTSASGLKNKGSLPWIRSWLLEAKAIGRTKPKPNPQKAIEEAPDLAQALKRYRSDLWQNHTLLLNSNSLPGKRR